jgi:hypothetical protein
MVRASYRPEKGKANLGGVFHGELAVVHARTPTTQCRILTRFLQESLSKSQPIGPVIWKA